MESYATAAQVYAAGLVFARVGAMVMLVPGLGDASVPPRIRLSFALIMALVLTPLVAPNVVIPPQVSGVAAGVIRETLIGLMLGSILRLVFTALATAGEVVAIQTTLGFAQTASPNQAQPSSTLSTFLTLMGTVLVMTTDLHHLFFGAMVNSFKLFPFDGNLPVTDAGTLAVQTVAQSFSLGIQLAAPVIVFSIVFNLATGLVGRVMPQFQIFFVASPLAVIFGLAIFAISLGAVGMVWTGRYRELLQVFA
ncbi:flagellar biosynthetic protein FliR [Caulobacter mirabilis]|uniref:Flagellar biosynthetic protein FliR n=1 Tax=Caulobacter mirabilis TaxID=69666 RepID=A0A2D2AVI2_9CAUL|nr:flagellar biosynthetic protein FliR [Caulobacter mirabilis]ATQ41985.1 flagellar biosynthetic protein FliR [Caulobacter mirabilis]